MVTRPGELVDGRLCLHHQLRQPQPFELRLMSQGAHELDRTAPDGGERRGAGALLAVLAEPAAPFLRVNAGACRLARCAHGQMPSTRRATLAAAHGTRGGSCFDEGSYD